jgi:hypothetical protein
MFSSVFDRLVKESPISVMARAAMERALGYPRAAFLDFAWRLSPT